MVMEEWEKETEHETPTLNQQNRTIIHLFEEGSFEINIEISVPA